MLPNVDRQGNLQPGYQYVYEVPSSGGGTQRIVIRDDAGGHIYIDDPTQNRGPHFNTPDGGHYDY
ncbi:HNH/endonuclease VII fold putative polymorphic toxin [Oleidesulfovibrio sp.]|uniref:HNH/endonuclease VII fold putative polymorphic toxin n=1 Tax=Oleidesulfovibrio sp. TaxID=2909707 RepID=UPI003A85CA8C